MEDKSFQQAMEELRNRVAAHILDEGKERLRFISKGQTVAEATADIEDPRLQAAVGDLLLYLQAVSLPGGLAIIGVFNQKQADELRAYLKARLAPQLFEA